jgi:carboxyl-terminal processing protease
MDSRPATAIDPDGRGKPRRRRAAAIAAVAALALALAGCKSLPGAAPKAADDPADLDLLQDAMKQVEQSYVVPVKPDQLVKGALKGMLSRLDPHSDYMDDREYQELMTVTSGQFGGVGIELSVEEGVPQVISAIDGTPAARAGIEPGDRIVKADGQPTLGMDIEDIVKRLRGAPGTQVMLTIARANHPQFDVPITRAVIRVESVKNELEPSRIGYVRISTFGDTTTAELADAMTHLRQRAAGNFAGFILDLRDNAGGLLDAAVDVASDFLDSGTVVTTRGRDADENQVYAAPAHGDLIRGVPMVVLINGASASASEIVAGALQDNRRAMVMGTRSFGKGSVQSIIPLGDSHGALRLTTALYFTPSGRSIQGRGITPDVVVEVPKDEQVSNAIITYEGDLFGALKNGGSLNSTEPQAAPSPPAADHPINPKIIGTPQDAQLKAAIDYLLKRRSAGPH